MRNVKIPALSVHPKALLIYIGPIVTLFLLLRYRSLGIANCEIASIHLTESKVFVGELTNRYFFTLISLIFCLASLVAMSMSLSAIPRQGVLLRRQLVATWLTLTTIASVAILCDPGRTYDMVCGAFFDNTIFSKKYSPPTSKSFDISAPKPLYELFMNAVNVTACAVTAAVATAVIAIIGAPLPKAKSGLSRDRAKALLREFAARTAKLNALLYMSSIVLVIGVLHVRSWARWPTPFIQDGVKQKEFLELGSVVSASYGIFFSLILASIFAPAISILDKRASSLEHAIGMPPTSRPAWPEWNLAAALQWVAILAPFIVPQLGDLSKILVPH